ncbi:MAG: M23 family metallopeptidase, partial [Candidatus Cloacimonadota bacterium]|nr:M23 family metallopeptidase [Candidatus Cloacimonadota bacterium]
DLLYSAEYIDLLSSHHSPFRDGKDFQTLCDDYIHNRYQDYYGSNRRTGACKRIHEGIDFFVPKNTPVYPIGKIGIVTKVSHNPNFLVKAGCLRTQDPADSVLVEYGKIVKVLYPEGYSSLYAHLDKVDVEENQIVYSDTKLGETGVTGNLLRSGKASHLHMELRDKNGNSFDPKHRLYYNNSNFRKFINLLNFDDKHGDKG